ncbi:hypothetical protein [Sneathiella aquimaris]|nr:hypothetical protein [Sneathiella aquimaris]
MTLRSRKTKQVVFLVLMTLVIVFVYQYAASQGTSKRLNLNTPVSFPVDI